MKFGDHVIYDEFGKQYHAIVLGVRQLESHAGEHGEPLLNLAFAREVLDFNSKPQDLSGTGSWTKLLQVRHDVAHVSRENVDIEGKSRRYEGGRWSEAQ